MRYGKVNTEKIQNYITSAKKLQRRDDSILDGGCKKS
jgi:hypothetical protein